MNKHKDFIKRAYNGELGLTMCSEWKELIEGNYPEFKTEIPKINNWYVFKDEDCNFLFYINEIDKDRFNALGGYGFDDDEWDESLNWLDDSEFNLLRLATDKEIEQALIKEAKKLGFKEGVRYLSPNNKFNRFIKEPFYLNEDNDALCCKNGDFIFYKGKWAEII